MAASQAMIVAQLLDAYDFGAHRRLLDVGGGDGVLAGAAAARHEQLAVEVFDLPAVADRARAGFARAGIASRARATGGNFFTDPLPAGADLVTLVRVLFDHDDASALAVLKAARTALAPGGALLVAEPMAGGRIAPRVGDAYFGFYLLAMGKGRSRSSADLTGLIARAGFSRVREVDTALPLACGLLVARP
jgi:demethylspheroidene O-methyltransferase